MEEKINWKFYLISGLIVLLIPTVIGLILSLVFANWIYLESLYVLFGCLDLLFALFKSHRYDSKNYKKNRSLYVDKKSKEFKEYRKTQLSLYSYGIVCILLSLLVYFLA